MKKKQKQRQLTVNEKKLGILCLKVARDLADRKSVYGMMHDLRELCTDVMSDEVLQSFHRLSRLTNG